MAFLRGAAGAESPQDNRLPNRRCCSRARILADMWEIVVLRLGSQTGVVTDLCAHGVGVQAVHPLTAHADFETSFQLPFTQDVIEAQCEVAWADNRSRAGFKFVRIADATKQSLESWLATHLDERGSDTSKLIPVTHHALPLLPAVEKSIAKWEPPAAAYLYSPIYAAETELSLLEQKIADNETVARPELLQRIADLLCTLTLADGGAVVLQESEGIVCRASSGNAPDIGAVLKPHSHLTAECFRTGEVVSSRDAAEDSRVQQSNAGRLQLRSIVIAPIQVERATIGAVEVLSSRPFHFDEASIATVRRVANVVGLFLATAEQEEEKQPTNYDDALEAMSESTAHVEEGRVDTTHVVVDLLGPKVEAPVVRPRTALKVLSFIVLCLVICAFVAMFTVTSMRVKSPQQPTRKNHEGRPAMKNSEAQEAEPEKGGYPSANKPQPGPGVPVRGEPVPDNGVETSTAHGPEADITSDLVIPRSPRPSTTARPDARQPEQTVVAPHLSVTGVDEGETTTHFLEAPAVLPQLAKPQRRLRTSEVILGQALNQPLPAYPQQAVRSGVQGSVILHGVVAKDGSVKNLRVVQGNRLLATFAIEAVKNWRYEITYVDRVPTEVEFIQEFDFNLRGAPHVNLPLILPKGVVRGAPIDQPFPAYDPTQGIQGSVLLRGVIGLDGKVKSLRVLEGNPRLAQITLNAISRWRYQPSRLDGTPVEVPLVVIVNFRK
jgi:TonB family protein